MGILDQARLDLQQIVGDSVTGFAVTIAITAPSIDPIEVTGFHTKHHTGFDLDGVRVSSKTASVAIPEQQFIDLEYVVRNDKQEVSMKEFLVDVTDSTGILKNYIVRESYPDEALGLIVLILGDYE